MLQSAKLKYIYPIGLFIAFFLDGIIEQLFSRQLFQYPYSMVSNLTIIWMVLSIFFEGESHIHFVMWAFIIGLAFDWYYTGIFGVNVFIYPLVVILVRGIEPFLKNRFLEIFFVTSLAVGLSNALFYIVFQAFHFANVSTIFFIGYAFIPTIILNLSFLVIIYYPIKLLFRKTRGTNSRIFK